MKSWTGRRGAVGRRRERERAERRKVRGRKGVW